VSRALSSEASKDSALGGAAREKGAISSLARQRLMQELRHLSQNPHPAMDVFPVESNLAFWNVVMTGFHIILISQARRPFLHTHWHCLKPNVCFGHHRVYGWLLSHLLVDETSELRYLNLWHYRVYGIASKSLFQ